tara:strand:+ start:355 stop:660 length:306 start_codon:yes stop_codon:yes gene_type:complete
MRPGRIKARSGDGETSRTATDSAENGKKLHGLARSYEARATPIAGDGLSTYPRFGVRCRQSRGERDSRRIALAACISGVFSHIDVTTVAPVSVRTGRQVLV